MEKQDKLLPFVPYLFLFGSFSNDLLLLLKSTTDNKNRRVFFLLRLKSTTIGLFGWLEMEEEGNSIFPKASRTRSMLMKLQDRPTSLKSTKSLKHSSSDHSTPLKYQQHGNRVEELVKYMSSVPAYLQLLDRGSGSSQEKALNVGVLDWTHLQKYKNAPTNPPSSAQVMKTLINTDKTPESRYDPPGNCPRSRSSLRRMLDPLLRQKTSNQTKQEASSQVSIAVEAKPPAAPDAAAATTTRALLRVAWKNGYPLYTFSMNNTDILAATRRKPLFGDFECTYTFYYVHQILNKTKRQAMHSNVVGKMNVKLRNDHQTSSREFVLVGSQLQPSSLQPTYFIHDTQLAAIVIDKCQKRLAESSNTEMVSSSNSSSNQNRADEEEANNLYRSVVVILPNHVHGSSEHGPGAPSSLIDRWRSGGSCDCGGWDLGCPLTILTEKAQQSGSQLFIQGAGGHDRIPEFNLVVFKEGLYTVEFHKSTAVLQAFSASVAILHDRQNARCFSKLQSQH